ncbi:hypothetical protein BATDEDRAFT_37049 [Batrachochytrium dendrobatidis JAM81]|uniref:Cytochrome b5 heme-binding domain-containing protein n=1 Tax=Batrachochytrium dendrobatidis (strain JAM81 / FGSC 10211) TaxID=684364 RepID=F4P426_BATDJ|nr:uncharacterized protein BATDEDRAFT_37049 [Batrachochytrium dendrobatidis JAM81]EGF79963.1 hypothetical protein BATDEDRAFT_37049 [Batrachochytrium dendrobatidis JAM81]KAJ8323217.1 hypothetical protein O5D80_007987 [Batrachochytrium dendrobatidis]KAK5672928.1 hypothetical protein QVD99_000411 [Batrachochytrium dendrobatidis]|eukprot:XP_006679606.1 hypothetical protein BATDEDRAFT_37049 [Batrachochytrium dendrobatidis JAM81]
MTASQPSETKKQSAAQFTWAQVHASGDAFAEAAKSSTSAKATSHVAAYIVIQNKVYDIGGSFANWHPGGNVALSQVGYDASGAFEAMHGPKAVSMLSKFYVGELAPSEIIKPSGFLNEVQELRTKIKQNNWNKADPLYYAGKLTANLTMLTVSIFILAAYGNNIAGLITSSFILALFWQQSGWLAHDFLHHQVFKTRSYNNAMGYFIGNVCQGFSVAWWKDKHCTHHSTTNIHSKDPDIDTMPYLAWSEHAIEGFADISDQKVAEFLVQNQPILYFPLLTFARVMWALQSLTWNIQSTKKFTFPTLPVVERVCLAVHYSWLFGAAFLLVHPVRGLVWILLAQLFCGIFLASVFSLNHNGMPVYSIKDAQKMEFYEISIRTGRNVDPTHFNNWFTGGLNFQIEHHMFPTVPRHNLKYVAPIVHDICKRHNIPYHCTGFMSGMGEVVGRLGTIARLATKLQIQRAD